jgi:RHS repeat-associated protein
VFTPAGVVSGRADYGPFGEEVSASASIPKSYAHLFRDGDVGQDYAQARMYQPRTGRFNAPDLVYSNLFDPQRLNRYTYALNDPLGYVDPTGLTAESCEWIEGWVPVGDDGDGYMSGQLVCPKERAGDQGGVGGWSVSLWDWLFAPINGDVYQPDWTGVPTAQEVINAVGAAHEKYTDAVTEVMGLGDVNACATAGSSCAAAAMAVVPAKKLVSIVKVVGHHPWPKYLGGAAKQLLEKTPESLHKLYHRALDDFLPRWVGKAHYDNFDAVARTQMLQTLGDVTKRFDATYGTTFYDAMKRNGFPF